MPAERTEAKEQYLEWLLTPEAERLPAKKSEFAEQHGVTIRTLYNWETSREFKERLREFKMRLGAAWYGDILQRLMQIVLEGTDNSSIQAAKVLLSYLEIDSPEDAKALEPSDLQGIRAFLEAEGYTVHDR